MPPQWTARRAKATFPRVHRTAGPTARLAGRTAGRRTECSRPSSITSPPARSTKRSRPRPRGDDIRFLAGGQSLLPMMKTRLATPAKLVDINGIPGLDAPRADQRPPAGRRARPPRRHRALRPHVRRHRVGGAVDLRPARPQPRHALRFGRPLRPRGRLELGVARHRRRRRRTRARRRAGHPHRRVRRRLLHQRARRGRDGDGGAHPRARRAGRVARTRSSNARSATTRRSRWPRTSSSPPTARSRGPGVALTAVTR